LKNDHVADILEQWRTQRPDLDCSPVAIVGRISRMEKIMRPQILEGISPFSLSAIEFDILATLRRNNCPLTPTALYQAAMLSSGAMTTNIDKLVKRELVERTFSAQDRRSCQIALTEKGYLLMEQAYVSHIENEQRMLEPLNSDEQEQLASLLQRWLVANE